LSTIRPEYIARWASFNNLFSFFLWIRIN
jgi:hypothetical protein